MYIGWPIDKEDTEIALFANMAVLRYIWCPIGKVGPKIALFPSQPVHLVAH